MEIATGRPPPLSSVQRHLGWLVGCRARKAEETPPGVGAASQRVGRGAHGSQVAFLGIKSFQGHGVLMALTE